MLTAALCCLLLGAPSGEIAFVSGTEQEEQCVCILDLADGAVQRVGPGRRDNAPRWSPDGAWIAFESQQREGIGIYIVRADGSEGRFLDHGHPWNARPRWSPEGRRLAYSADPGMGIGESLMVYDLDTSTETAWGGTWGEEDGTRLLGLLRPVWLPTNRLMLALHPDARAEQDAAGLGLLAQEAEASGAILAVGLVGTPQQYSTELFLVSRTTAVPLLPILTEDSGRFAEWAIESNRKGEQLAFESNDGGDREIFVLTKRGLHDLSNHHAADWNPVWSQDGKWLAFESFRGGARGVYRAFAETARIFPVAAGPGHDNWAPAWSQDGEWLAYVSNRTGDPEIYATHTGSGETHRLTNRAGPDLAPAWRPEAK